MKGDTRIQMGVTFGTVSGAAVGFIAGGGMAGQLSWMVLGVCTAIGMVIGTIAGVLWDEQKSKNVDKDF